MLVNDYFNGEKQDTIKNYLNKRNALVLTLNGNSWIATDASSLCLCCDPSSGCLRLERDETRAPVVLWARSLMTTPWPHQRLNERRPAGTNHLYYLRSLISRWAYANGSGAHPQRRPEVSRKLSKRTIFDRRDSWVSYDPNHIRSFCPTPVTSLK